MTWVYGALLAALAVFPVLELRAAIRRSRR
jgi:hypothetical protein